jgi:hypothetical protein
VVTVLNKVFLPFSMCAFSSCRSDLMLGDSGNPLELVPRIESIERLRLVSVAGGSARPLGATVRWSGTTTRPGRRGSGTG